MVENYNRRKKHRKVKSPMGIGIVYLKQDPYEKRYAGGPKKPAHYTDLLNKSDEGVCLRVTQPMALEEPFIMQICNPHEQKWDSCLCSGKWISQDKGNPDLFVMGCEYKLLDDKTIWNSRQKANEVPSPWDYECLKETRFLKSIDRAGLCPLLNALSFRQVAAGETIMEQGEKGDSCFIIQKGTCTVFIEQEGKKHQIGRITKGCIVGEMAILTGEVRSASVEAETEMELWRIQRESFDRICAKHPGVRNFLTELVTQRFTTRKRTAKRDIGKYVITDIIGKGGYAMVYGGLHRDLNMAVAVKMMKHDMAMNEDFLKNFRDEAKLIAQFNHRNIVRVYDIEERFRTIFIIMELLHGIPLEKKLSNVSKLPYSEVIDYLVQISSGLMYAHQKGVVHQDIKPANIFIRNNHQVKILDFGLACPISTRNIDFLGSPYYMSPEQIEMEAVDERSDIYSLGIMTYEMVLGQRPYPEDDLVRLEDLHLEEDIPDPKKLDPDIPEELRQFILKACSREKKSRYRDMKEVLELLIPLQDIYRPEKKEIPMENRKITSIVLIFNQEDQPNLAKLLEELRLKAQNLGITLKVAGSPDL